MTTVTTIATNSLEFVSFNNYKYFLRWYLDEYDFIKVEFIKVRD